MSEFFIPTKCCPRNSSHEVFEFVSSNKKDKLVEKDFSKKDNTEEIIMKKARFEVYKFAQTGLSNVERKKSQLELAVKLGAVPKKEKSINYKIFKENSAKKKAEERQNTLQNLKLKTKSKNMKGKLNKKRKVGSGILKSYGKVKKR